MSSEETLALDAMRADNIIDLETRQQYEALNDAAMGDYMGVDDRDNPFTNAARGRDECGINLDEVSDSDATGYVPPIDYSQLNVGSTPTSGRQQAIAEAETPNRGECMKQIAFEITGIAGRLRPGPEANRLYDLAWEIDELFKS